MWTHLPGGAGALSSEQCFALLAAPGHGLLNLTRHPLAEPVRLHYRVVDHELRLRPAPIGALLDALLAADVVLEVDATDAHAQHGWHVVVTGTVTTVDGELLLHPTDLAGFRLAPTRVG